QAAGHIHGDAGAFKVLLIRPENDHQRIRDGKGEQCLLVEPGVGVDEQVIQLQVGNQVAEGVVHVAGVIFLAQDTGNVIGVDAGRDQVDFAAIPAAVHQVCRILNGAVAPQDVV